ncbi:hypothetical protein ACOZ0S_002457 [Cronobacter dublinensis]
MTTWTVFKSSLTTPLSPEKEIRGSLQIKECRTWHDIERIKEGLSKFAQTVAIRFYKVKPLRMVVTPASTGATISC